MGSSSSVAKQPSPQPARVSTAPSARRARGFQEVQFQTPEGASGTQQRPQASTSRRESRREDPLAISSRISQQRWQDSYDKMTHYDGFSDLGSVATHLQRQKTMFTEKDQPKYEVRFIIILST